MCPIPQQEAARRRSSDSTGSPAAAAGRDRDVSCFTSRRLNASTFVIIEDDKWREQPFIYAKVYPSALVLVDTGCGGAARDHDAGQTSLREYIETVPLADNGGEPLNPGASREYVVICTHCHFDHIGGIAQFPEAAVWASSHDKSFLARENLDTTSLCRFVGMQTPRYAVTHWADDGQEVTATTATTHGGGSDGGSKGLNLFIYHAPGHTPDEAAIWDPAERVLFVGDTMYERVAILLPVDGGDVAAYFATVDKLRALVDGWDAEGTAAGSSSKKVTMACGHATSAADAAGLLDAVDSFLCRVLLGEIEGESAGEGFRGEPLVAYRDDDDAPGSNSRGLNMRAAEKVLAKFRGDEDAMDKLRGRRERRSW